MDEFIDRHPVAAPEDIILGAAEEDDKDGPANDPKKRTWADLLRVSEEYKYKIYNPRLGPLYDAHIISFRITVPEKPHKLKLSDSAAFKSESLYKMLNDLHEVYTALDYYYFKNTGLYERLIKKDLNPYYTLRDELARKLGHPATNAYMKMREIAVNYDLMHKYDAVNGRSKEKISNAFCNAELPGNFILALKDLHPGIKVVGSSYITKDESIAGGIFGDDYGLLRNHPDWWLISYDTIDEYDGDVTKPGNLDYVIKKLGRASQDLYTSDIGIGLDNIGFYDAENVRAKIYYGAMIAGIATCAVGGAMVLKMFSFYYTANLADVVYLASLFDEFYVCKPVTSHAYNIEVYLVGVGFRGVSDEDVAFLRKRLEDYDLTKCIIDMEEAPGPYIESVANARKIIGYRGMAYHEYLLDLMRRKDYRGDGRLYADLREQWKQKYFT